MNYLARARKEHMPLERFRKIIDDINPYVSTVTICGRGEPLLHNNLCEMIRYASDRGLTTIISTNGTILNENIAKNLINSGLSVISFSSDGYNKETYDTIRVGSRFDKALNNILQFIKLKNDMKSNNPHVTLQIIYINNIEKVSTREDKNRFWKKFEGLTLDRVYIKSAHN